MGLVRREPGRHLCQDVALPAQAMVLTAKLGQFLAVSGAGQFRSLACISIGLAHPIGDGVQGWLKLPCQAAKRTASTVELHQLLAKFWRVGRPVTASRETPSVVVSGCPQQRGNSNIAVSDPMRLLVEDQPALILAFHRCFPRGCFAEGQLSEGDVGTLARGAYSWRAKKRHSVP